MFKKLKKIALICASAIFGLAPIQGLQAQSAGLNDWFYYEIGGSAASHGAGGYRDYVLIDASTDFRLGLSCGKFDLEENIEQLFESFNSIGDNIVNAAIGAANAFIDSLPLLILREAWPNLADMYEQLMARYEELIRISIRECQETERMILAGENPWNDWIKISRGRKWNSSQENGSSATETSDEVANGPPEPILWIDGKQAGIDVDILIVEDLVRFGYEQLTQTSGGRASAVWPNVQDAIDYAHRVLGEIEIDLDDVPASSPGEGVLPSMEEQQEEIQELITKAVMDDGADYEELLAMSSPTVQLTSTIISRLRSHDAGTREFLIHRLANEIATANAAERILLVRRMLTMAMREPHVMATPAFETVKNDLLPELIAEYQFLTDTAELNRMFVSHTAKVLMQQYETQRTRSTIYVGSPNNPDTSEGVLLK